MIKYSTVDEYIASFPKETQKVLNQIRTTIKRVAPDAAESISYGMPGYKLNKEPLVYFAGWKTHIGFYPTPTVTEAFKKDLADFKTSKGTVQFPLNQPIPLDLIEKITKFRVKEMETKKK